jgi:hypothetical protein
LCSRGALAALAVPAVQADLVGLVDQAEMVPVVVPDQEMATVMAQVPIRLARIKTKISISISIKINLSMTNNINTGISTSISKGKPLEEE